MNAIKQLGSPYGTVVFCIALIVYVGYNMYQKTTVDINIVTAILAGMGLTVRRAIANTKKG